METACAALLAAYFGGMQPAALDKTRIYEIPASTMAQMNLAQRVTAKACAVHYGVRYKVIAAQTQTYDASFN